MMMRIVNFRLANFRRANSRFANSGFANSRFAKSRFGLALAVTTVLVMLLAFMVPGQAADPSAAGLWQKIEDGKPVVWVLVVDHDGIFEGVIAKTFPKPGEAPILAARNGTTTARQ